MVGCGANRDSESDGRANGGGPRRRTRRTRAPGTRGATGGLFIGLFALLMGLLAAAPPLPAASAAPSGNVVVDPSFRPRGGIGALVAASVVQPDGKVVVVGPFSSVNGVPRTTITRLNVDGTLDPSFNTGSGFDGPVRDLTLQPDGKIIAVGTFVNVNGVPRPLVVRLLSDGQVDPTFDARPGYAATSGTEPAGPIDSDAASWQWAGSSVRLRPTQEVAGSARVPGASAVEPATGDPVVDGVALAPDGTVVVYGANLRFDGSGTMVIARLTADGRYDPSFDSPYANGQAIGDVVVQPNGRLVVSGYDYLASQPILARLLSSGSIDATWANSACNGPVWDLLRLGDGTLLAAGGFTSCGGNARRGLVKVTSGGAVDPSFSTGTGFDRMGEPMGPDDMSVMPDGRLAVAGFFTGVDGVLRPGIAVLSAVGGLDAGFVPAAPGGPVPSVAGAAVWQVRVQAGGRLLIAGMFGSVGGVARTGAARLEADGGLDVSYNPVLYQGVGVDSWTSDALVQPDGKIVVAGGFGDYNGDSARALVRLNSNGSRDGTFSTNGTGLAFVDAVVRQPDGRYVVAGGVVVTPTVVVFAVIRLNPDGSRDPSFSAQRYDLAPDQQIVHVLALQPDGKVLVAGQFTGPGGRANLMRLGSNGLPDPAFSIGSGFTHPALGLLGVRTLVLQADGRIVAAGGFTQVNGAARAGIVRLHPSGAVDLSFNPGSGFTGTQAVVWAVAPAPGGRLWAVGRFDTYNGQSRQSIARLNGNGSLDTGFVPAGGTLAPFLPSQATLTSLIAQPDGKVIATGNFVSFGGVARSGILRLTATGALETGLDPGAGFAAGSLITQMLRQPDGAIVVVGQFQGFNGAFPVPLGLTRLVVVSAVPGVPTDVSVTNGNGALLVTCTPPVAGGGGWAQRYEFSVDNGATWPVSSDVPMARINGLLNGQTYQVRVRAVNLVGAGAASPSVVGIPVAPMATTFVAIPPVRVVDSRLLYGGPGPIPGGTSRVMSVASRQSDGTPAVPVGAVAIAYNLTAVAPAGPGHMRVMPGDAQGLTSASAVNYRAHESIANAATVRIDPDRHIKVYTAATADVLVDVMGYYVPSAPPGGASTLNGTGKKFTALTPIRIYDTAADPAGDLPAIASRVISTATTQDGLTPVVPAGATAVAYNITVLSPSGFGHLRVQPADDHVLTETSVIGFRAGDRIANAAVVAVDYLGRMRVYNGATSSVRFLVDVVGYYSDSGAEFYPVDPVRTTDTRPAYGGSGPVAPGPTGVRTASLAANQTGEFAVVPTGAAAASYNVAVVATGSMGHLRVYPAGAPLVSASALNWPGAGYARANASTVGVSPAREVQVYNGATTPTEVLIDVNGYYQ